MRKNVSKNPKECKRCGEQFLPNSNRQEYCETCIANLNKERCSARYKKTYVKRGYNQVRENNNAWIDGRGVYDTFVVKDKCSVCGSSLKLVVHHRDRNRTNNSVSNLVVLCRRCHQNLHVLRCPITGRFIPQK